MADFNELNFGETLRGLREGMRVFVSRYVLKRKLGRGGMGEVWLAEDTELEEAVALKFLPELARQDPVAIDDLRRETRKSRRLAHPNIVRVHDFLLDEQYAAISMEYIEGRTLSEIRLQKVGKVYEAQDLEPVLEQICGALEYAHQDAKIVHRDLKPANVLQTGDWKLKIADFGISASITDTVSRVSAQASSSGTPVYMSPQQLMGERPSAADDVYSLGALLFELLTGKPPFYTGNVIVQVQTKPAPSVAQMREELDVTGDSVPAKWERLIASCLDKDAQKRPRSANAVLKLLKADDVSLRRAEEKKPHVEMMACSSCGLEISRAARFCHHCGAEVKKETEEQPEETLQAEPPPLPQPEATSETNPTEPTLRPEELPEEKQSVSSSAGSRVSSGSVVLKGHLLYWMGALLFGVGLGYNQRFIFMASFGYSFRHVILGTVALFASIFVCHKSKNPLLVLILIFVSLVSFAVGTAVWMPYPDIILEGAVSMFSVSFLYLIGYIIYLSRISPVVEGTKPAGAEIKLQDRLYSLPTILFVLVNIVVAIVVALFVKETGEELPLGIYWVFALPISICCCSIYWARFPHILVITMVVYATSFFCFAAFYDAPSDGDILAMLAVAGISAGLGGLFGLIGKRMQRKKFEESNP